MHTGVELLCITAWPCVVVYWCLSSLFHSFFFCHSIIGCEFFPSHPGLAVFTQSFSLHPDSRSPDPSATFLSPSVICVWTGIYGTGAADTSYGSSISAYLPSSSKTHAICASLSTVHCIITVPCDAPSSATRVHCANNLCGYCAHSY